jgi:hypothetical protein
MCKGMNRSIINVLLGGFGSDSGAAGRRRRGDRAPVKAGSPEDAAYIMKNAARSSSCRLRHGGGAGAAGGAGDGGPLEEGGRRRAPTPSTPSPAACPAT